MCSFLKKKNTCYISVMFLSFFLGVNESIITDKQMACRASDYILNNTTETEGNNFRKKSPVRNRKLCSFLVNLNSYI